MYGDLHCVPAEVKGFGRVNGSLASLGTIKDLSIFAIAYIRTPTGNIYDHTIHSYTRGNHKWTFWHNNYLFGTGQIKNTSWRYILAFALF